MAPPSTRLPAMKPRRRFRRWAWVTAGFLAVVVVALSLRTGTRQASYYFPVWYRPDWTQATVAERFEELTNVTQSLPIVLAAVNRSPRTLKLGQKVEAIRRKLPQSVGARLPQYRAPDGKPWHWLALYSCDPEVARTVSDQWVRWSESLRGDWVFNQWLYAPRDCLAQRPEYVPLLRESCRNTNPNLAFSGVALLLRFRPVNAENAEVIAHALTNHGNATGDPMDHLLAQQLAGLEAPPRAIVAALKVWLASPAPRRAALAALVLAQLDPVAFPPETVLEPVWRQLQPETGRSLVLLLAKPEFQRLASSPWAINFLAGLLAVDPANAPGAPFGAAPPQAEILSVIGSAAPAGGKLSPIILPLLSSTNGSVSRAAGKAWALLTPALPEHVSGFAQQLTNEFAAAPLLLWLTSLGTNAAPAYREVERLARETVRFPQRRASPKMNTAIARRYGLIQPEPSDEAASAQAPAADRNWRKPSQIIVSAAQDCPRGLERYWPGYERASRLAASGASETRRDTPVSVNLDTLPASNLAELARRCLANITPGLSPPDSPRDPPKP